MEGKGEQLMQDGEKILKKFSLFGSKTEKAENARELFVQAATNFKASQNFGRAAQAYERAAEMAEQAKSEIDYIQDCQDAAAMLQKAGDRRATEMLTRVIDLYDKQGKYTNAAKLCVTLADDDHTKKEDKIAIYQRAIKYYKTTNSRASIAELTQKIAEVNISNNDYSSARVTFQKLGEEALDDRLSRGMARKYFFMSLLCDLASIAGHSISEGIENLKERFENFQDLDNQFTEHTREFMLIRDVIAAMEEGSIEAFEDAVTEYDNICPLDSVKAKMLLRGKQLLRDRDNDLR